MVPNKEYFLDIIDFKATSSERMVTVNLYFQQKLRLTFFMENEMQSIVVITLVLIKRTIYVLTFSYNYLWYNDVPIRSYCF